MGCKGVRSAITAIIYTGNIRLGKQYELSHLDEQKMVRGANC